MNRADICFTLPCRAASVKGLLKHTYLTNKVSLKTLPEDLRQSMLYMHEGQLQHQVMRRLILELLDSMESSDMGFSPAKLVDQLAPFRYLSNEQRYNMRRRIHEEYLHKFNLNNRRDRLARLANDFLNNLDQFLFQDSGNGSAQRAAMDKVLEKARELIRELDTLPKGIWLH